jgi:predicted nuclease of restriction endonuclease-like (RecB) superfamily
MKLIEEIRLCRRWWAQLPWSHHLIILGLSKCTEECEFYVRLAIRERWSKRELERQFKTALFCRVRNCLS